MKLEGRLKEAVIKNESNFRAYSHTHTHTHKRCVGMWYDSLNNACQFMLMNLNLVNLQ